MKDRHIKVYEAPGQARDIPHIRIQGKWLADLGFHIGDHITITSVDDKLIIAHDEIEVVQTADTQAK